MLLLSYVVYQNLQVLQTYFKIIMPRAARKFCRPGSRRKALLVICWDFCELLLLFLGA